MEPAQLNDYWSTDFGLNKASVLLKIRKEGNSVRGSLLFWPSVGFFGLFGVISADEKIDSQYEELYFFMGCDFRICNCNARSANF